jgi:hypothetical protein
VFSRCQDEQSPSAPATFFGAWGDGTVLLEGAHIPRDDPQAESVSATFDTVLIAALVCTAPGTERTSS